MTKEELVAKLTLIRDEGGDIEADHSDADDALIEYIGDAEVTRLYQSIAKWYA